MKSTKFTNIAAALIAIGLSGSLQAVETKEHLTLSSENLESLFIDSGAGFLDIKGQEGLKEIRVDAKITVDGVDDDEAAEWFEDHMKLSLNNKNGKATLIAKFEENSVFSWGWNNDRTIDLSVTLPADLKLEVDDGSGWSKVSNLKADLEFDDGSGTLTISDIQGNLIVDDGSGDLTVKDIDGDLFIDDGSGSLIVDQVTGKVDIEDGSGSIKITNIGKSVYIDDGSGSVDACHLGADLTVDDGSGSVDTCDDIEGTVVVK